MNTKAERVKAGRIAQAKFNRLGISRRQFAREQGVSDSLVYEILAGRKACNRGKSHRIAVLLGMKAGDVPAPEISATEAVAQAR